MSRDKRKQNGYYDYNDCCINPSKSINVVDIGNTFISHLFERFVAQFSTHDPALSSVELAKIYFAHFIQTREFLCDLINVIENAIKSIPYELKQQFIDAVDNANCLVNEINDY